MLRKKQFMKALITMLFACMVLSGCASSTETSMVAVNSATESLGENSDNDNKDTIGSIAPCGVIFGNPLYIGYASDFGNALDGIASVAESYSDESGEEKVWIYSPGGIPEVAIIPVSCKNDEWLAHGQRLAMPLKSNEILELVTAVPEGSNPNEAFVCYSEDMETQYAYAIGLNGETGLVNAFLIEITGVGEAWY